MAVIFLVILFFWVMLYLCYPSCLSPSSSDFCRFPCLFSFALSLFFIGLLICRSLYFSCLLFSLLTLLVLFHERYSAILLVFMIGPVVLPVCLLSSPPCMLFVLGVILPAFWCGIFFAFCLCRVYSSLPFIRLVCFRGLKLFFCEISLPPVFHLFNDFNPCLLIFWCFTFVYLTCASDRTSGTE